MLVKATKLARGEVHVWLAKVYEPSASQLATLSEAELRRAMGSAHPEVRARFLAASVMRRAVLSQYLDCSPGELSFDQGPWGKPALLEPLSSSLQFNSSHSEQRLVLAVSAGAPIGVDIQYHKSAELDYLRLAERFFAAAELEMLRACAQEEQSQTFYRIWTRKEAFVKALGEGISWGLQRFTVSSAQAGMHCLLSVDESAKLARHWTLGSIPLVEQGYSAALAVKGQVDTLRVYHW